MSDQVEDLKEIQFFSGKVIGRSLREVAVDLIQSESEDLISRWFRGPSTDLFTWADHKNNIIKQQLNFNGQVVEWNCLEGIKTGVVIETDLGAIPIEGSVATARQKNEQVSESIKFDRQPQSATVSQALEILSHAELTASLRDQLLGNFKNPQSIQSMPAGEFLKRFGQSFKTVNKASDRSGFLSSGDKRLVRNGFLPELGSRLASQLKRSWMAFMACFRSSRR